MQVLSYKTNYLAFRAYNIYCYFIYYVFYHIMFHFEPQSCIYPCRTTYMETKQMGNSTNLAGKLNMFNLPCKTVQDYPARLHASYCATLQRVGYLARCCTQYIARYLARNIASCRQAFILSYLPVVIIIIK